MEHDSSNGGRPRKRHFRPGASPAVSALRFGLAALFSLFASACASVETGPPPALGDDATGFPGAGVAVYELSNREYFERQPGGTVTVRPAQQGTIAISCDTGWGRSCALGVGVAKGAPCYCKSVWGAIPGHAF